MANRVYRGSYDKEPRTISKVVGAALLPATFVTLGATFAQATAISGSRVGILGVRDMYQGVITDAYASGDTAVAYRIEPEQEYTVALAAGTYTLGQELTLAASGRLAAAASTNVVVAYFDDAAKAGVAQSAGALADVVIANFYTKA